MKQCRKLRVQPRGGYLPWREQLERMAASAGLKAASYASHPSYAAAVLIATPEAVAVLAGRMAQCAAAIAFLAYPDLREVD
jgi:hypothetical protein